MIRRILYTALLFSILQPYVFANRQNDALDSLYQDICDKIYTLNEDKYVFNYRDVSNSYIRFLDVIIPYRTYNKEKLIQDLKSQANSRFTNTHQIDKAGNGVYAATNPYISIDYGGDIPQLSIITLRKDLKLINTTLRSEKFSDKTMSLLKTVYDCEVNATIRDLAFFCAKVFNDLVKRYNISGIIFNFFELLDPNCIDNNSAVVLFDEKIFNLKNVKFFGDLTTSDLTTIKYIKKQIIDRGGRIDAKSTDSFLRQLATVADLKDNEMDGYNKWRDKMLFCKD